MELNPNAVTNTSNGFKKLKPFFMAAIPVQIAPQPNKIKPPNLLGL